MVKHLAYTCVKSEGGILPYDLLQRVAASDRDLAGTRPEDYHLLPRERIDEGVTRAWTRALGAWAALREAMDKLPKSDLLTRPTREFLLVLLQELGYGRVPASGGLHVDDKDFAISHLHGHTPMHLLGWRVDLDKRQAGIAGAAQASPHGLVQDFFNRSDKHLWGYVSNGALFRVLRDHPQPDAPCLRRVRSRGDVRAAALRRIPLAVAGVPRVAPRGRTA